MGHQDAKFKSQIFRKDNPIIIAAKRERAIFLGGRIAYDSTGYLPGQCLVRKVSDGLFYKWSAASGSSYDSPVVLFDQATDYDQLADGSGQGGVSGASLVRVLAGAIVYTTLLVDYDATFKTALGGRDYIDAAGTQLTKF